MNILGISGLENAVPFKQEHWPGLDPREYRISQGHDAAAALICDGQLIGAAEEERFNLRKHSGAFPIGAASYCFREKGITIGEVDEIVHGFEYSPYRNIYSLDPLSAELYCRVFSREALLEQISRHFPGFPSERVYQVNHHLAHAASAYFTSGWDECVVVVIDAMGEVQSATIYRGRDGKLEKLREISASHSIGILYSLVTLHLGFDFNSDEYKIMGLAPYGRPERDRSFFDKAVQLCSDGSLCIPILNVNHTRDERENYTATRQYLAAKLIAERQPSEEVTEDHRDVAAALQECLERAVMHICEHARDLTGLRRVALAGGVALNCTANGKLVQSGSFDEVYIQPVAGDDGVALGAALYWGSLAGEVCNVRMPAPLLGPTYTGEQIENDLADFLDRVDVVRSPSLQSACSDAAALIAGGKVVAWYRGRMEYGPRALGNRSILADPSHPEMRDRINAMVKMREAFRPFAPAVSVEEVSKWFEVEPMTDMPYMITPVMSGEREVLKFPDVIIMLTKAESSGGTEGSVVNHVGFRVANTLQFSAKMKAAGYKVEPSPLSPRAVANVFIPEGERIELLEDLSKNVEFTFADGQKPPEQKMTVPITLHHIHFFVPEGSVKEAKAWYVKMFGALPGRRYHYEAADLPGVNLNFSGLPTKLAPTKGRMLDHIGFEIKNLEAFCKKLEASGVKLDAPYTKLPSGIANAFLTDPWGSYIELTEGLNRW